MHKLLRPYAKDKLLYLRNYKLAEKTALSIKMY